MVDVAQLVRASVCGTEGRGFEPLHLPQKKTVKIWQSFFNFNCFIKAHNHELYYFWNSAVGCW